MLVMCPGPDLQGNVRFSKCHFVSIFAINQDSSGDKSVSLKILHFEVQAPGTFQSANS